MKPEFIVGRSTGHIVVTVDPPKASGTDPVTLQLPMRSYDAASSSDMRTSRYVISVSARTLEASMRAGLNVDM